MISDQARSNWFQYPAHGDNIRTFFVNVLEERLEVRMVVIGSRVTRSTHQHKQSFNDPGLDPSAHSLLDLQPNKQNNPDA